jgi:hypothetical protein
MALSTKPFAEIVSSSLHEWRAECWNWECMPSFGMPVVIESSSHLLFGIVHLLETTSLDPHRTATAYQLPLEELKREQPHIFLLLKTYFNCIHIGYKEGGYMHYNLAPQPPLLHSFVRKPTQQEEQLLFSSPMLLAMLFQRRAHILHFDELLVSLLSYGIRAHLIALKPFLAVINTHYGHEHFKVRLLLQRIDQQYV